MSFHVATRQPSASWPEMKVTAEARIAINPAGPAKVGEIVFPVDLIGAAGWAQLRFAAYERPAADAGNHRFGLVGWVRGRVLAGCGRAHSDTRTGAEPGTLRDHWRVAQWRVATLSRSATPERRSISALDSLRKVGRPWLHVAARGVASIWRSSASISAAFSRRPARIAAVAGQPRDHRVQPRVQRRGLVQLRQFVGEVAQQRPRLGRAERRGQRAHQHRARRRTPRSPGRAAPVRRRAPAAGRRRPAAGRPPPAAAAAGVRTPPSSICSRSASWVSRSCAACWSTSTRLPSAATAIT